MRIGIDLDGVIFDSEKLYRIYSELYDIQDLKRNSLIDNKQVKFEKRYSWNQDETNGFVKKSQKTPKAEKELAKKYKADYERRYGDE